MGFQDYLIRSLQSLYHDQTAKIATPAGLTNGFRIGKGVRQGCPLSPMLFNIYGEAIIREACVGAETGVRIGGTLVNELRYADDTVLITNSDLELTELLK